MDFVRAVMCVQQRSQIVEAVETDEQPTESAKCVEISACFSRETRYQYRIVISSRSSQALPSFDKLPQSRKPLCVKSALSKKHHWRERNSSQSHTEHEIWRNL